MAARHRRRKPNKAHTTQVVTAGTTISFEEPKSSRSEPKEPLVMSVVQDINPVKGFTDFLREYAVIGLIIGFVLSTQMTVVVRAVVAGFLDPLTKLLFGTALSDRIFTM